MVRRAVNALCVLCSVLCVCTQGLELVGAGASLPALLLRSVALGYQATQDPTLRLNYTSLGSRHGQCRILQNFTDPVCAALQDAPPRFVDFASTDLAFSDQEYHDVHDLQMYPMIAAGVVPTYNVPSLQGPSRPNLALHLTTLARIFRGNITHWRDPALVEDKAVQDRGLQDLLPDAPIVVCARADVSGSTGIMKSALASFDAEFATHVPVDGSPAWSRNGVLPSNFVLWYGSQGALACVSQIPNSISYAVYSVAKTLEGEGLVRVVDLVKLAGTIVATRATISSALYEFSWGFGTGETSGRLTASLTNAQGVSSWPIVGFSYVAMRKDFVTPTRTCAQKTATLLFFKYLLTDPLAQQLIRDQGFAALPSSLHELVLSRMNADLTCEGTPVFHAPLNTTLTLYGPSSTQLLFDVFSAQYSILPTESELRYQTEEIPLRALLGRVRRYSKTRASGAVLPRSVIRAVDLGEDLAELPYLALLYVVSVGLCGETPFEECKFASVRLDPAAVARVFGGQSVRWNDPALTRLNPALQGVTDVVQVILRDDPTDLYLLRVFGRRADPHFEPVPTANVTHTVALARLLSSNNSIALLPVTLLRHAQRFVGTATLVDDALELSLDQAMIAQCLQHSLDLAATPRRGCYPLVMVFSVVVRSSYSHCDGVNAGNQLTEFVQWMLGSNVTKALIGDTWEGYVPVMQLPSWFTACNSRIGEITCDDECIVCLQADHHAVPGSTRAGMFGLAALWLLACAGLLVWIYRNHESGVVALAQPLFLYLCVVGCIVQTSTVFFRAEAGEYNSLTGRLTNHDKADAFCSMSYWTYNLGITLVECALLAKMWRVRRIFVKSRGFQTRVKITPRDAVVVVAVGLGVQFAVLGGWQLADPPRLVVDEREVDALGRVRDSVWACTTRSNTLLVLLLLGVAVVGLVAGNCLCFLCREIPTHHAEGKWISLTFFGMLQTYVVATPVLMLMDLPPASRFGLESSVVLVQVAQVLGFVFAPKLWAANCKRARTSGRDHSSGSLHGSFHKAPSELDMLDDQANAK